MKRRPVNAAALALALLLILLSVTCAAEPARYGRTHTAPDYAKRNAMSAKIYYNGCGRALDGTDGSADLCVPGLSEEDGMIPQGIAVREDNNTVLISAYSDRDKGSVIFSLHMDTGAILAEYHVYRASGNTANAHFGGIAVSRYNLYIADYDSTISYIPLSALNVTDGSAAEVTIAGTADAAAFMNGANTSFVGSDGDMLWTGNFYKAVDKNYNKKASGKSGAVLLCFPLSGGGPADEWNSITNGTATAAPLHTLNIPDIFPGVQGAYLADDKVFLSQSSGRNNDGTLRIADVDYSGEKIKALGAASVAAIPGCEDLDISGGTIYTLSETAAHLYMGGDGKKPSKNAYDTIWAIDADALTESAQTGLKGILQRISAFFKGLIIRLKGAIS